MQLGHSPKDKYISAKSKSSLVKSSKYFKMKKVLSGKDRIPESEGCLSEITLSQSFPNGISRLFRISNNKFLAGCNDSPNKSTSNQNQCAVMFTLGLGSQNKYEIIDFKPVDPKQLQCKGNSNFPSRQSLH